VRLTDDGTAMIGYKDRFERDPVYGTPDQHRLTSMWSDQLVGRPENAMTGVSFVRGGYHRIGRTVSSGAGGYTVYEPEHWAFAGTDAAYGDLIGARGVVVGYECDGCDFVLRDGRATPTGADGTPADFTILGIAPAQHFHRDNAPRTPRPQDRTEREFIAWRALGGDDEATADTIARGHAVMGVHEPGGFVFTAGTTDWACGLTGQDPEIEQITRNLLDRGLAR
jgi:hypothetical protein